MSTSIQKRNSGVELTRLVACLTVIATHVAPGIITEYGFDKGRVLLKCISADGVAVFWVIMGLFLFRNTSYKQLIKRTLIKVITPAIMFNIILFFFQGTLIYMEPLKVSMSHSAEEYISSLKNLTTMTTGTIMWYVYIYFMIVLLFPVLKNFVRYLNDTNTEKYFILFTLVLFIWNDLTKNSLMNFSNHTLSAVVPACMEVVCGHILWKNREKILEKYNWVYFVLSAAMIIVLNLLRTYIRIYYFDVYEIEWILYWFSSFGLVDAMLLLVGNIFLMNKINNIVINKVITGVASQTFYIYLMHTTVIAWLREKEFFEVLESRFGGGSNGFVKDVLYMMASVITVFAICFIISMVVKSIGLLCKQIKIRILH